MADRAGAPVAGRQKQILDAAFDCFVRYGYSKITLQDVARAAGVSRPLIYTFYRGKEDLFLAVFVSIFADQLDRVRNIARADQSIRNRLFAIFEIVYLELWDKLNSSAEGLDLIDATTRLFPRIAAGYTSDIIEIIAGLLGDVQLAPLLLLSGKGMCYDRPSTTVLRERLTATIDVFVRDAMAHSQ